MTIEQGGTTALVAVAGALVRINLRASGAATTMNFERFVVEPGGASALVGWSTGCCAVSGQFGRVNLTTGAVTMLAMPYFAQVHSFAFDGAGANLFYSDTVTGSSPNNAMHGSVMRIPAP